MTALVVLALVLGLAVLAALGRPLLTLGVLAGTTLLLPATLLVPGSPTALLTGARLVEAGAVVGVVLAARRGDLGAARLPAPLVAVPLLAYLAVVAVTGVARAGAAVDPTVASYSWVGQAEMVVVLALAVALGRGTRPRDALLVVAAAGTAAALVGVLEAATGQSWSRALFHAVPDQLASLQAQVLEQRGGGVQVRAAADFALAYGWVLVAVLPTVAAAAVAARRREQRLLSGLLLAALPVLAGGVLLSRSRSPLLGLLVVGALTAAALLPRRPLVLAGGALVALGGVLALGPSLLARLARGVDAGSVDVRVQRLPDVLALAADHPLRGAGLSSITSLGLAGVDASYIQVYVEAGALALTLLVVALVATLAGLLRGLGPATGAVEDPDDRLLVLAAGLGLLALVVAAATYDVFTVLGSSRLAWLLAGLGLAAAERRRAPLELPRLHALLRPARVGLVLAAVGVGVAVRVTAPAHGAGVAEFRTLDVRTEVRDDPRGLATTLVATTCDAARGVAQVGQPWHVSACSEAGSPGWGRLRLEGPDPDVTLAGFVRVQEQLRRLPGLSALRIGLDATGVVSGVPSPARVAPEVLGLLALSAALLVPERRRR